MESIIKDPMSLERIKSSMKINNPVTVTQDEPHTVEHSQNITSVRTPNRPPLKHNKHKLDIFNTV